MGKVRPRLVVEPGHLQFDSNQATGAVKRVIVRSLTGDTFSILEASCAGAPLTVQFQAGESRAVHVLTVALTGEAPTKFYAGHVTLVTDFAKQPEAKFLVSVLPLNSTSGGSSK
jgi:hypothetical protein